MAVPPPSMRHMQVLAVLLAVVIVAMVTLAPGRLRGPSPPGGLSRAAQRDGGFFDDAPAAAVADDETAREDENEADASAVVIPAADAGAVVAAASNASSSVGAAAAVSGGGLRKGRRRKRKGGKWRGKGRGKGRGGDSSAATAAPPVGANATGPAAAASAAPAPGAYDAADGDGEEGEDEAAAPSAAAAGDEGGSDDASAGGSSGDDEPNPVRDAYARLVAAVGALPEEQRRYVVVKPAPAQGGWGAKVLVAVAALKLALGTGRPLLFANDDVVPLVPHGFLPPHRPFLLSEAPWVDMRRSPRLSHVGKRYNDVWRCWRTARALGPCVPGLMPPPAPTTAPPAAAAAPASPSPPPPPQALVFETGVSVQKDIDGSADLAGAYAAALGAPAAPLPSRPDFDRLAVAALFGSPAPRVAALVAAARSSLRWDSYAVRVGVHIRTRPEAKRKGVAPGAIRAGFWACAARQIAAAQAAAAAAAGGGRPLPPNATLVYIAADRPSARGLAARRLAAALAAVGGTGAGTGAGAVAAGWLDAYDAFTHTGATGVSPGAVDAAADRYAAVLADWLLLGDVDVVVGTEGSAFGATAAMRTGAPYVRAALKSDRCARVLRGGAAATTSDGDGGGGAG